MVSTNDCASTVAQKCSYWCTKVQLPLHKSAPTDAQKFSYCGNLFP